MKTTTKLYTTLTAAEKAATAKTKKTGIEHYALENDEGKFMVLSNEEFDSLTSSPEEVKEEVQEEVQEGVYGWAQEEVVEEPKEQTEEQKLLDEVVGMMEAAEVTEIEPGTPEEVQEEVAQEEVKEEVKAEEEVKEEEVQEAAQEAVKPKVFEPFGLKIGYTQELEIPYFGLEGTKYLKTADPAGNRIRLASSRVHIVKINGEKVKILTTPTYAAHRAFI